MRNHRLKTIAALALVMATGACSTELGPDPERVFNQVERLGNPLVSEVFFPKRDHAFHNATAPSTDAANFTALLESFVTSVGGRSATVATTLSSVLLPDMLIVQTDRAGDTAGWLSWALADGYGGRKLSDDVVDAGLLAVFGPLLDANNVSPGLSTDNVSANDNTFGTTFPYLPPGN